MRHYLKSLIISTASFYAAYSLVPTINLGSDFKNILVVIGGIFFVFQIINPIFSLILLPINHLTFGLVMFILNISLIFAFLNFLPGFEVSAFNFPGANVEGIIVPAIDLNVLSTIILIALIVSLVQKILHLIFE